MFKTGPRDLPILKPFLEYLQALKPGDLEGIESDPWVVQKLESI